MDIFSTESLTLTDGAKPYYSAIRKEYADLPLRSSDLDSDPIIQVRQWVHDAIQSGLSEPNAAILSTSSPDGRPSARTVLIKNVSEEGLLFFTHYNSRKGAELIANPHATLVFLWKELERQIIIEAIAKKTSTELSEEYFHSRPRESQISVWASKQGTPILSRDDLESTYAYYETKFAGIEVPYPDFWGGFCLNPHRIEFWKGRPNRLHDRFEYIHSREPGWTIYRLSP